MRFLKQGRIRLHFAVLIILCCVFISSAVWGQDAYQKLSDTENLVNKYPFVYAITNAAVIVGNGQTMNNATIILKDGLIADIGSRVEIPGEAVVIDASGMTVYPGLFDSHTSLGFASGGGGGSRGNFQAPQTPQQGQRGGQQQTEEPPPPLKREHDQNLRPDKSAADDINFNDSNFADAWSAGFTAVLSINRQGVFPGKSSVILTHAEDPMLGILNNSSYQFIQSSAVRGGYPQTLMAVIAFQRQGLLDAQYYLDINNRMKNGKKGFPRMGYDPVIEDLFPVVAGDETVIIPASTEMEIKSAVDLAKQFNLKYMLSGVTEGYRVLDLLKSEKVPVILSVNYPRARSTTGYAFNMPFTPYEPTPPPGGVRQGRGGTDPAAELDERINGQLHGNALTLHEAGIPFVFTSGGSYDNFLENIRLAVKAGLPEDVALAKMTTEPAKMFGVSDVIATVEKGKIANLVITDGNIFGENTVIKNVFVDGKKVELKESSASPAQRAGRGR
ncbi:amidohydrolase family protein [candidate division KSB1 bacterium]